MRGKLTPNETAAETSAPKHSRMVHGCLGMPYGHLIQAGPIRDGPRNKGWRTQKEVSLALAVKSRHEI